MYIGLWYVGFVQGVTTRCARCDDTLLPGHDPLKISGDFDTVFIRFYTVLYSCILLLYDFIRFILIYIDLN